jgi:hypothetical protein
MGSRREQIMKYTILIAAILAISTAGCAKKPTDKQPMHISDTLQVLKDDFASRSKNWQVEDGEWIWQNGMLIQTATKRYFPLILNTSKRLGTVDITVRFQPRSGRMDASGGIVFRAHDRENYYIVRANALENNYRLYTFRDGIRSQIDTATVTPPALGRWHTMRVTAQGDHIQAWLDGKLYLDHHDVAFASGYTGLWTKADSVTAFDDFLVKGE